MKAQLLSAISRDDVAQLQFLLHGHLYGKFTSDYLHSIFQDRIAVETLVSFIQADFDLNQPLNDKETRIIGFACKCTALECFKLLLQIDCLEVKFKLLPIELYNRHQKNTIAQIFHSDRRCDQLFLVPNDKEDFDRVIKP